MFLLCKENQPFSIVENEDLKNLLKVIAPHYKVLSRASVTRCLDDNYDTVAVQYLTLTSDISSDLLMRSYLYFGVGIEFQSLIQGVYHLDERYSSEYIAQMLKNPCYECGFNSDKVTALVTDNAANMMKAIDIGFGKKKHIQCFAHTPNLVAQYILGIPELHPI